MAFTYLDEAESMDEVNALAKRYSAAHPDEYVRTGSDFGCGWIATAKRLDFRNAAAEAFYFKAGTRKPYSPRMVERYRSYMHDGDGVAD